MKHCPECNKNYADPTLSFCLNDGAPLIHGHAVEEPDTAVIHDTNAAGDAPTRRHIHTTTGAEVERRSNDVSESKDRRSLLWVSVVAGLLIVVAVGGFAGYRYFDSDDSGRIGSIAVLPFENRSGSSDTDYLSDGLADSLIYRLTQLPAPLCTL